MSALGKKLWQGDGYVMFRCPGCNDSHMVSVDSGIPGRDWGFNGNGDAPTFTPSVLVRNGHHTPSFLTRTGHHDPDRKSDSCWCTYNAEQIAKGEPPAPFKCQVCHSYVTDGRITFLADCTHALAGQTVDLPDYPGEKSL